MVADLQEFPAESRPGTEDYVSTLHVLLSGSASNPKKAGTARSRRNYWLHFAYVMKWHLQDDDYFMIDKDLVSKNRAQIQLAAFAIHLSMGNNLYCRRIKLGTIKEYVNAVAHLTAIHRAEDVRKDNPVDQSAGKYLTAVYKELKRWEDVPNRREATTPEMLLHAHERADKAPPDSLDSVLADWYTIGIFAGLRCGEYAQTDTRCTDPNRPTKDFRGGTRAFCIKDFRVQTKSGRRLKGAAILSVPMDDIVSVWLKWRTQKNNDNGLERLFRRSKKSGRINIIRAMYRIVDRFVRLRGADDVNTPLSVYKSTTGETLLVTSDNITHHMRAIAIDVYKLDPEKDADDISRWSSHSLRVGACVFLHARGFGPLDIKWLLRWNSDAYKVYLRNFHGLSDRQAAAFDQIGDATAEALANVYGLPF